MECTSDKGWCDRHVIVSNSIDTSDNVDTLTLTTLTLMI